MFERGAEGKSARCSSFKLMFQRGAEVKSARWFTAQWSVKWGDRERPSVASDFITGIKYGAKRARLAFIISKEKKMADNVWNLIRRVTQAILGRNLRLIE